MQKILNRGVVFPFCVWLLGSGCFPKITPYTDGEHFKSAKGIPEYLSLDYWAAHPLKWDPSDSIQKDLNYVSLKKKVNVFFLHPTSLTEESRVNELNARIDDPYINRKTDYTSILYQASIFSDQCDVYAPRYRQAHIGMYYETDTIKARNAFELAYEDVKNAFRAFVSCLPNDRAFIIASHSQGTTHATRLIKEFVDDKPLQKRLVAAYLIGMPVPKMSFNNIRVCEDSSGTGCFVSWRTFQRGYTNNYISLTDSTIAVVNPITWETNAKVSEKKEHRGAILYNYQKLYVGTHKAQVMGNALFITKPKFPGSFVVRMKNYHAGDYNLFYEDIRQDVKRRIGNYNWENLEN